MNTADIMADLQVSFESLESPNIIFAVLVVYQKLNLRFQSIKNKRSLILTSDQVNAFTSYCQHDVH